MSVHPLESNSAVQLPSGTDFTKRAVRNRRKVRQDALSTGRIVQGAQAQRTRPANLEVHIARLVMPTEVEQVREIGRLEQVTGRADDAALEPLTKDGRLLHQLMNFSLNLATKARYW